MKKCKKCKTLNTDDAVFCSSCGKKLKEPKSKKKKIIIAVVIILLVIIIGSGLSGGSDTPDVSQKDDSSVSAVDKTTKPEKNEPKATKPTTTEPETEAVPFESLNALRQAKNYLSISGFSAKGLKQQLSFEGYSDEACNYAVENCGADWNEQAARKAQDYMNINAFSKSGLIQQLKFEGFTAEQAEYGAKAVGY